MKISEFRSMLKHNSVIFFTYKKLTDNLYRTSMLDYIFQKQVKPREVIKKELDLVKNYWKCDPMSYYRYRLYEKNLTREELLDYIPPFYFYNFYVPSIYDEARINMAASKIQMNDYFKARQIPTPKAVAIALSGKIISDGEPLNYKRLLDKLKSSDSKKFFMKPDTGKGGKGIFRLEKFGGEIFIDNEFMTPEIFSELVNHQDYIIQEGITQRNDMMSMYPLSVNTLRVITQNFNGDARISATSLRMGRRGTFVDNVASGGIMAKIDPESGMIAKYALDLDTNSKFDHHPDTGFLFEGFVIRDWENIKTSILDFARKASEFPDIGWDIAIIEGSIVVIELNLNWGIDIQGIVGGMRRMLKIDPFIAPKEIAIR
jgi:hypothetical protein